MSNQTLNLDQKLYEYLLSVSLREPDVLNRLRALTAKLPESNMQIAPEQGQFMRMLVQLTNAKRIIEIGTFTGYSALSLALGLPEDGLLVCCDSNKQWPSIGKSFWEEAGVDHKIKFMHGMAIDTLNSLLEKEPDSFDMVFIDADKISYQAYFEASLKLIRQGGLILVDNTLWNGAVANAKENDTSTVAIRAFNKALLDDVRVDISLLPLGDGLTLIRKK
jgi:predicted O-methyltransferase YrrM